MTQQQNQVNLNLNLHRQRLIALGIALVAVISMLFNWSSPKTGITGIESQNGFASWGFMSLAGILGVVAVSFVGDKAQPYAGQFKQIVMAAFGLIALGAIIFMIRIFTGSSEFNTFEGRQTYKLNQLVSPSFGLFLCIIAGAAGLVLISGVIKMPVNAGSNRPATSGLVPPPVPGAVPPTTGSTPPPPPPPPSS
jgi:hypothetical protein